MRRSLWLLMVGVLLLSACSQVSIATRNDPTPAPPTVTPVPPEPTLPPTATPVPPTPTPVPPTPTPTPIPPPPTPTPPPRELSVTYGPQTIDIAVIEAGGPTIPVVSVESRFNHPLFDDFVVLSPDGNYVLYATSEITNTMNAALWVAHVDGSGTYRVAQFSDQLWSAPPIWSPDSTHIAYVTKALDSPPDDGLQLWMMQRDGSNPALIQQGAPFRPSLFAHMPEGVLRWSADGAHITYNDRWSTPPGRFSIELATGITSRSDSPKQAALLEQRLAPRAVPSLACPFPVLNQKNYAAFMFPCEQRICRAGCAVTAASLLLTYYGVPTTPATLNTCMAELACPLWWGDVAAQCSQGMVQGISFLEPFSYAALDEELAAGRPVIVHITTPTGGTHFVVVTGGGGQVPGGYTISDPVDGSSTRTLARYADHGWTLAQVYRYSGQPTCADATGSDPDGGPIAAGQVISGTIGAPGDSDDFFLNVAAGDTVDLQVRASDNPLDPYVVLYDPAEMYVIHDDDSGGGGDALLRGSVATGGRYRIRVGGYGDSSGPYTLVVRGGSGP